MYYEVYYNRCYNATMTQQNYIVTVITHRPNIHKNDFVQKNKADINRTYIIL